MTTTQSFAPKYQLMLDFFNSKNTLPVQYRIEQLKKLRTAIQNNESLIVQALQSDLRKPEFECYGSEISLIYADIDDTIKSIKGWTEPKRVPTPALHAIASSFIYQNPYGLVLIIAPWNYPFLLSFTPLIGAISAGNCVVLKPSEIAPESSKIITKIIREAFNERYIASVEGGVLETQDLLKQKWNYIFYTGNTQVGKIIYQKAAETLTPVTLELGGKNPCFVDESANIALSAKRIMWGKLMNAGQTCVAPDYILVHENVKNQLVNELKKSIQSFYSEHAMNSNDYCKIINEKHFERLSKMLTDANILYGGKVNKETFMIEPTLIDTVTWDSTCMQEEIFGPILPIFTYSNLHDAINQVRTKPKPLASYIFSNSNKNIETVLQEVTSGGAGVNEVVMHISSKYLPFGGVGDSGIGAYHGNASFHTFSHSKSVLKKSNIIDVPVRYAPYKLPISIVKKLFAFLA